MSRLIISIHIPKTAGTSFGVFLKEAFKEKMVFVMRCFKCGANVFGCEQAGVINKHKNSCDTQHNILIADLARFVIADHIKCIHGHILPAEIYPYFPRAQYVVWLREPVERTVSDFEFVKRHSQWEVFLKKQREAVGKNNLMEFAFNSSNTQSYWTHNFSLKRFSFIGIVEEFEQDIKRFSDQFNISATRIPRANTNPNKTAKKYQLDEETRKAIEKSNLLDFALYADGLRMRGQENRMIYRCQRFIDGSVVALVQRAPVIGRLMVKIKNRYQMLKSYLKSRFL